MSRNKPAHYYENHEFNITTGTTDALASANSATWLTVFDTASNDPGVLPSQMSFRTNNTVSIRINGLTNPQITITSNDSPFKLEDVYIKEVYISNSSGSTAAVKILLTE